MQRSVVALGLVLYAALAGGYAALSGNRRLGDSARNALVAAFVACLAASRRASGARSYRTTSLPLRRRALEPRATGARYAFTAFWGGQEGSLLLWALVLTGDRLGRGLLNRRLVADVLPWTVPILGSVASFFLLLLVFVSSPFATTPEPADGAGLNTSLQNPYMMAHPPLLYLGYVGLTIPFAFAMAALVSRRRRRAVDRRHAALDARRPGPSSAIGILLGASGPTRRSAGVAGTRGTPSRMRR